MQLDIQNVYVHPNDMPKDKICYMASKDGKMWVKKSNYLFDSLTSIGVNPIGEKQEEVYLADYKGSPEKIYTKLEDIPEGESGFFVGRDGIWEKKVTTECYFIEKAVEVPFLREQKPVIALKCSKFPMELIHQTMEFFRAVFQKYKSEAAVLLAFSPEKGWSIHPTPQEVTGAHVKYKMDLADELKADNYIIAGTIHSHNTMAAFFSGTDNSDDGEFDGLHMVFGRITAPQPEMVARFISSGKELAMKAQDLIENYDGLFGGEIDPKTKFDEVYGKWLKEFVREPSKGTYSDKNTKWDANSLAYHFNDPWWEREETARLAKEEAEKNGTSLALVNQKCVGTIKRTVMAGDKDNLLEIVKRFNLLSPKGRLDITLRLIEGFADKDNGVWDFKDVLKGIFDIACTAPDATVFDIYAKHHLDADEEITKYSEFIEDEKNRQEDLEWERANNSSRPELDDTQVIPVVNSKSKQKERFKKFDVLQKVGIGTYFRVIGIHKRTFSVKDLQTGKETSFKKRNSSEYVQFVPAATVTGFLSLEQEEAIFLLDPAELPPVVTKDLFKLRTDKTYQGDPS